MMNKSENQTTPTRFGVGYTGEYQGNISDSPVYRDWWTMLSRCYSSTHCKGRSNSYEGAEVCTEWWSFSNFEKWAMSQFRKEGWSLDKDLFSNGRKMYSSETCCYIPMLLNKKLNGIFTSTGVWKSGNQWRAGIRLDGKTKHIGYFKNRQDAIAAYRNRKALYILGIANEYKSLVPAYIYDRIVTVSELIISLPGREQEVAEGM